MILNWMNGYGALALILLCVGLFFEIAYIGTILANRKGRHVSGVLLMAGIFFCLALAAFPLTRRIWFCGMLFDVSFYAVIYTIIVELKPNKNKYKYRITVLSDNTEFEDYKGEHGLSLYIEYGPDKILLDAGRSGLFLENAKKLGIDLSEVDIAVLSHSHYDHADGLDEFFKVNDTAKVYMRKEAGECYYSMHDDGMKYIGPKKGMLEKYKDRIVYVEEDLTYIGKSSYTIALLPHSTHGLSSLGENAKLYKKVGEDYVPDDFSHEQTLCIDNGKGLIIINSCSHGGVENIINEVRKEYDGYSQKRSVYAYIGGFHLFKSSDEEIIKLANTLKEVECERFITGHCTGDHAYEVLKNELGDRVEQFHAGMLIEL
ncbi:MAG: MBL fold metallo-hydrolase [Lachnospiraceae bacterium]|nr:MBL fold metallo-hydrolase [Lachnospiraceae bacterium]